jgi:hypothetical protein
MCGAQSTPQQVSLVQFNSPSVKVSWNPGPPVGASPVPLQFEVFRKVGSATAEMFQLIGTCSQTGSTSTCAVDPITGIYSYTDSTAAPGTFYSYKVRALSVPSGSASQLISPFSEVKSITPIGAVAIIQPGNMISPDIGHAQLKVEWNQVPGAQSYSVLIRPSGTPDYFSAGIVAGPQNPIPVSQYSNGVVPSAIIDRFINSNTNLSILTPGTTYEIKIRANGPAAAPENSRESDVVLGTPMDLPYITGICRGSDYFRFHLSREPTGSSAVMGLNTAQVFMKPMDVVDESPLGSPVVGYAPNGALYIDFPQSAIPATAILPVELRVKISNSNGFLYSKSLVGGSNIEDYFIYTPGMAISPCPP